MHEPPVFAFTEAALFWVAFIWAFLPEIRHSGIVAGAPSNTQDAGTLRLINIGSDVALLSAFIVSFLPWLIIPYPRIALYAGTGLLIAGSLLRRYCFRILGKYFTAAVTVSADQPVIDKGPYRWIRHPGYAAGFRVPWHWPRPRQLAQPDHLLPRNLLRLQSSRQGGRESLAQHNRRAISRVHGTNKAVRTVHLLKFGKTG